MYMNKLQAAQYEDVIQHALTEIVFYTHVPFKKY